MSQENVEIAQGVRIPVHLRRIRRRRTLDEQLLVRFPALARMLGLAWQALPVGSRLRRAILLRIAAQVSGAVVRRDFDSLLAPFDPEFEYRVLGAGGLIAPDQLGTYRGHEGYREVWRLWLEASEDVRLQPEELIDLGDRLVSVTRVTGHGTRSGVPINQQVGQVFTFERGLVVRQEDFPDRHQAFEAAGLSE
jgi:ketosteroid isomerase-like protein